MSRKRLGSRALVVLTALLCASATAAAAPRDVYDRVRHGYADSSGVRIHYATLGRGPLVVMIHGFPDFWYSWRDQMAALSDRFQVVAIDQRGYNLSDKPAGTESYDLFTLANDVVAVVHHLGHESATIVGHDWGGTVAWILAMFQPSVVERLVILNSPHPLGLFRELRENPEQRRNSGYAEAFMRDDAHLALTAEGLAGWVADPEARVRYVEAFQRSDFAAMLAYYKQNYPRAPYDPPIPAESFPPVEAPVLIVHGLEDPFVLAACLDRTWEWVADDLTVITVPGAGHFVQQDASARVTAALESWLDERTDGPSCSVRRRRLPRER